MSKSFKSISAFGEDKDHETIIGMLIERIAQEMNVGVEIKWRRSSRGYGKVISDLREYLYDIKSQGTFVDLIVVATDANCKGYNTRYKEISIDRNFMPPIVCAIPDPHIEHWLLLDSAAFKKAFGYGFDAIKKKCERDFYKKSLSEAYINANVDPSGDSVEYARKIISKIDLKRAAKDDLSLQKFLDDLRQALK
ncbi:MAG: hypothetical protein ISN28_04670 [Ectothiorhodospiraceae bacterium AqS1]|nr:hypothetical protein [Ectothiorhodospiraceae bacterium AqS1]